MSEKEIPQIRNIAKFKKMREEMKAFKMLKNILPFASPFLKILGVNTKQMKEAFSSFDELENQFLELSELPDRFNDTFSSRGWILYDLLNLEIAIEALEIAETDINKAEQFLIDYYTPENVDFLLQMMQGVKAFRPRMDLAELALIDYKEERYHACIPVILALMDGLVNELNKTQNLAMSADDSDLKAWDSITAHEKGLNALKEVLFKTRKTTRTEEISIPYRHGILHGMDLGYANKTVAAKTWAALFAVRDWAIKAEGNEITEPPPKSETSWKEVLQQLQNNKIQKDMLEEWKPRNIILDNDIPKNGEIEDYPENSPERKVVEFFHYWKKHNYGYMSQCILSFLRNPESKIAKKVRDVYEKTSLKEFEFLKIIDEAPAVTEILVSLVFEKDNRIIEKQVQIRLVNEDSSGNFCIRGTEDSDWGIVNWTAIVFENQS